MRIFTRRRMVSYDITVSGTVVPEKNIHLLFRPLRINGSFLMIVIAQRRELESGIVSGRAPRVHKYIAVTDGPALIGIHAGFGIFPVLSIR